MLGACFPQSLFPQQESTEGARQLSRDLRLGTLSFTLCLLDAGRATAFPVKV